jgi:hypothetical protein
MVVYTSRATGWQPDGIFTRVLSSMFSYVPKFCFMQNILYAVDTKSSFSLKLHYKLFCHRLSIRTVHF